MLWSGGALLLGAAIGDTVSVCNPATGATADIKPGEAVNTLQWSSNNKVLAIGGHGGSVGLFSAGNYLGSLPLDSLKPADMDEVTVARFSKDSKLLHTGSRSSVIYTWDLKQQAEMGAFREHRSRITSLAVAQSDEHLASASADGTLLLHTPGAAKALATIARGAEGAPVKRCLCFSALEPGLLAAACDDATVCLWSTRAGQLVPHVLPFMHSGPATGVALCHTNAALLLSCGADRQLLAIDRRVGGGSATVVQQARLPSPLSCLGLCDNDATVAVGAVDGSIYVHDVRKLGQPTRQMQAGQALPVTDLHWQSTARHRRAHAAGAPKPAAPAPAAPQAAAVPPRPPSAAAQPPPAARASAATPPQPAPQQAVQQSPLQAPLQQAAPPRTPSLQGPAAEVSTSSYTVPRKSSDGASPGGPRLGSGASTALPLPSPSPRLPAKPGSAPAASSTAPPGSVPRINMLTEGVFKAYMDDAITGVREDLRNLHIEMLKQFHVQQMEVNASMLNVLGRLEARQDSLGADVRALKQQLEQLMRQQSSWP